MQLLTLTYYVLINFLVTMAYTKRFMDTSITANAISSSINEIKNRTLKKELQLNQLC
jgi:uncharacterized membrane protein (DUF485 family)